MIHVIAVPYDSGRRGERMGAGPLRLLDAGVVGRMEEAGHDVHVTVVETTPGRWPGEIAAAFDLAGQVAALVREAMGAGAFPLVLSGNCGPAAIGCVCGIREVSHIFWFDAHGDFNTPETTIGGFLDGMALATLTGRCWSQLAAGLAGFRPISENAVTLIGARDLDPLEANALAASGIRHLRASDVQGQLSARSHADGPGAAYVHLDLDVLDPSAGLINSYSVAGGLTVSEVRETLAQIRRQTHVAAASVTALDPARDSSDRAMASAIELCVALVSEP
jgi:arginase